MKKLIALLLVLALMLSFAACSKDSDKESDDDKKTSQDKTDKEDKEDKEEITFTELTVIDNEACSIKITKIAPKEILGYTLKAQLENKSSDKTYRFSVESASINGVYGDPYFTAEVAAGKKANSDISFSELTFEGNDIGKYTDIELVFTVQDSEDWSAEPVAEKTVHIYPYGEDKAIKFERKAQTTDNVILDNEYATVIVTGYKEDEILGYVAELYLVNKTDKTIVFDAEDESVNGFMMDSYYMDLIPAGKSAFSKMYWYNDTLEENGVEKVEEIEFTLTVSDTEDWSTGDYGNVTVTLNP